MRFLRGAAVWLLGPSLLWGNGQMELNVAESSQFYLFLLLLHLDHDHQLSAAFPSDVFAHVFSATEGSRTDRWSVFRKESSLVSTSSDGNGTK
uniref:Putative secreted protein n=1 Tax=Anopheles triannulatus TaxID=58253 RepID=A0A2M4B603_9DIPT